VTLKQRSHCIRRHATSYDALQHVEAFSPQHDATCSKTEEPMGHRQSRMWSNLHMM